MSKQIVKKVQRPYKVRKSFDDTKSQISSFAMEDRAIEKARECPGYNVYDGRNGRLVWSNDQIEVKDNKSFVKPKVEVVKFDETPPSVSEIPEEKVPWYKRIFRRKS